MRMSVLHDSPREKQGRQGPRPVDQEDHDNVRVRVRSLVENFKSKVDHGRVQLDWVVISLEVLGRSSAPHAPPITLRAYFDSPRRALPDWRFGIRKK